MTQKVNQDNKNILGMNSAYLDRIARTFDQKFENKRSRMFASGRICSAIRVSTIEGKKFYKFMLECKRQSDNSDVIPVAIKVSNESKSLEYVEFGTEITVIGTIRSRDWTDGDGHHHLEHFFEASYYDFSTSMVEDQFDKNIVILTGYLCTEPVIKVTKKKRTITEYRLAVENLNGETEYFPILAWGKRAVQIRKENHCGDKFIVLGRLQSRPYTKKNEGNFVAYEISSTYTIHINEKNRASKTGEEKHEKT